MTILTSPRLRNISKGFPFALGERADLLSAELDNGSNNYVKVAIKVLRAIPLHDIEAKKELRQSLEAQMEQWMSLDHPNVVKFLGLSYENPFPAALVLPFFEKGNARDYLKRIKTTQDSPSVEDTTIHLIQGAARGLDYLHNSSPAIIHGDIRACNVLVDDEGAARLVDFALVSALSGSSFTTADIVGPARWQAPEVFSMDEENFLPFNMKTDVFSFSMLCVELITGDRPFNNRRHDTTVIMDIIKGHRPIKPQGLPLAEKMWPLLARCWAQDSSKRPYISEVCELLEAIT